MLASSSVHPRPATRGLDDAEELANARLIAQLNLADIAEITAGRRRRPGISSQTDEDVALRLQAEHLQRTIRDLDDHFMAERLATALETDRPFLQMLDTVERAAADDRRAAMALSEGKRLPPVSLAQRMLEDPKTFTPLASSNTTFTPHPQSSTNTMPKRPFTGFARANRVPPGPTITAACSSQKSSFGSTFPSFSPFGQPSSKPVVQTPRYECAVCSEEVRDGRIVRGTCGHDYCPDCISNLVETCIRDESLYPPRCCKQPLAYSTFVSYLSLSVRKSFELKQVELDVPATSRIYCPRPTCSAFVGSSQTIFSSYVACGKCATYICTRCRQPAHPGTLCSENSAIKAVRELARVNQWQTCPGCKTIVELSTGCYHITCRCRTEFCYLCAVVWKNCTCQQWDEARLFETAHRRVEQEIEAPVPRLVFQERVQEMANTIRENHDCLNHRWGNMPGPAVCEECHDTMPLFIKVCRNCRLMACRRCALNRL